MLVAERTLTGVITALSTVANANLLSTVRIALADGQPFIGESAVLRFSPQSDTPSYNRLMLPLDVVSIIAE